VGDVTHILLFRGFNGLTAQLVSVQYSPATNIYQLWSPRPSTVNITLDNGVETAAIDIDGLGRMWLASAGVADINVRWSDAPYSSWSSPITIYTGVADDDICDVIYMPTAGQIGILWSNQKTKRFGFKTHSDDATPSAWSADEVPASQSAINFGHGMADDHLNFALASDGTLYCAVKTSYDSTGYPKIALLIRRPTGIWDSLYKVSETGTRGIALLNEALEKLKVVYSSSESGGNILYKETSTSNISFGPAVTLLQGTYNNPTSTKENYNSDILVLAGDTVHTYVGGVLLTETVSTSVPTVPVLITPSNATTKVIIPPNLKWSTAAGAASYQVQVSASSDFTSTIFDQSNIIATTVQVIGSTNSTLYYWRVRAANTFGSSDWSTIWSFTTASGSPLIAQWKMDEGSGTTLVDGGEYQNNATTVGSSVWVTGKIGQALKLDGTSQYATAPNSLSLSPTNSITIAAWIKPEQIATQYVIEKAAKGSTNGYELSLSSAGKVFLRVNQVTSGDTYRINSVTSYPADGNTWMHVAATYDGTVMKIYINGVLNASSTPASPPAISTNTLAVGIGAQSDGSSKFKGALDDAHIYNTALSASEILNIVAEAPPVAPVLASPVNNATGVVVNPTALSWKTVAAASSYQVQVSATSDFASPIFDQSNITDTTTQINGLANNAVYYWRVKATSNAGSSDWSQVWSFTTMSNSPLVAWWKMDEGSGTTLIDASDYHNNGTTVGSPVWVTGKVGQALQLNGTSQYTTAPNSAFLGPANAITTAAWIKPERTATQNIIKKAANSSTNGYELSLASTGKVFFRINQATSGDTYRITSVTSYPADGSTWMHIAATYDGAAMKIYINGVLDASVTPASPPTISTNALAVGIGAQPDGQFKFKGAIDDAHIYNNALSAFEIANLATATGTVIASSSLNSLQKTDIMNDLAYPNPFSTNAIVTFTLSYASTYTVELYNSSGIKVSIVKQGRAEAGKLNIVNVDGSGLSNGLYFVKLQVGEKSKTLKLVFQKW